MSDHNLLPTDPFDQQLSKLIGLPNGAHTSQAVVQAVDFYGKSTSYIVQTVRHEDEKGNVTHTTFVQQMNAAGAARYILPGAVLRTISRQIDSTTVQVRRRNGRRQAEERGAVGRPVFTPEMRAKAAETRKRNTARRRRRKASPERLG